MRAQRRSSHNLARYLVTHAGGLPAARPAPSPVASRIRDTMADRGRPADQQKPLMMAKLRSIWDVAGRYFPGHAMPVPQFTRAGTAGASGFTRNEKGQPVPVGVQFSRADIRQLLHPRDQFDRDQALRVVLHEWAHNRQSPAEYARRERRGQLIDPVLEGGAEGFAYASAPAIARALGRRYVGRGGLRDNEYRPYVRRMTRNRGMDWMMRGQFS
jgi:hypothetical protein